MSSHGSLVSASEPTNRDRMIDSHLIFRAVAHLGGHDDGLVDYAEACAAIAEHKRRRIKQRSALAHVLQSARTSLLLIFSERAIVVIIRRHLLRAHRYELHGASDGVQPLDSGYLILSKACVALAARGSNEALSVCHAAPHVRMVA